VDKKKWQHDDEFMLPSLFIHWGADHQAVSD